MNKTKLLEKIMLFNSFSYPKYLFKYYNYNLLMFTKLRLIARFSNKKQIPPIAAKGEKRKQSQRIQKPKQAPPEKLADKPIEKVVQKQIPSKQPSMNGPAQLFSFDRSKKGKNYLQPSAPQFNENEFRSKSQIAYQKAYEKKVYEALATKKFYEYQSQRGEDLIDRVPVEPYYQYKLKDFNDQLFEKAKMMKELKNQRFLQKPTNAEQINSMVTRFSQMKHRYEYEQFLKDIEKYPGSIKGSKPEDDPQVFSQYLDKITPKWLRQYFDSQRLRQPDEIKQQAAKMWQSPTDFLGKQARLSYPNQQSSEEQSRLRNMIEEDIDNAPMLSQYSPVPLYPETRFQQYHSYMHTLRLWGKFKRYYQQRDMQKKKKNLERIFEQLKNKQITQQTGVRPQPKQETKRSRKKKQAKIQSPSQSRFEIKDSKIYSLYTYYKTLPKSIQQNPGVRTVYLGLQYSSPDIPYEKKQELLNEAAKYSLPLDPFSDDAMEKLLQSDRTRLTPFIVEKIYNIDPVYTWDMKQFLEELKNEKLRSISTVKQKQQFFVEPPKKQFEWEQGMANLPVDFYDNEDGFWDEHIEQKLNKYQKVQPLSTKPKKHLIH